MSGSLQIIVHGTSEATNHLLGFAKKTLALSDDKIFAPGIGECVDATTESHIYQVSTYNISLVYTHLG